MKRWHETAEVVRRAAAATESGREAAVATVVRIDGSAYRRPGAKLFIGHDGQLFGGVSGGCLEADVREHALRAIERGAAAELLTYDTGPDDPWGLGLGCDGRIEVFVQTLRIAGLVGLAPRLRELLEDENAFRLATILAGPDAVGVSLLVRGQGIEAGDQLPHSSAVPVVRDAVMAQKENGSVSAGGYELFVEVLEPPPRLLVCGAGDDAIPVLEAASRVGFRVIVADHRERLLTAERLPEAHALIGATPDEVSRVGEVDYAIVMTHSLEHDRAWLEYLLSTGAQYVGMLGPKERTDRMMQALDVSGDRRVFGPVGLSLGSEGPEQVALSVVAEVLAVHHGGTPEHLRDRPGPIHA